MVIRSELAGLSDAEARRVLLERGRATAEVEALVGEVRPDGR